VRQQKLYAAVDKVEQDAGRALDDVHKAMKKLQAHAQEAVADVSNQVQAASSTAKDASTTLLDPVGQAKRGAGEMLERAEQALGLAPTVTPPPAPSSGGQMYEMPDIR